MGTNELGKYETVVGQPTGIAISGLEARRSEVKRVRGSWFVDMKLVVYILCGWPSRI